MVGQIERVRAFLRVAELASFASAARDLGTSRSRVTRYVSELETELDAQLLVRTTRRVSLTAAGRIYFERTRPLVDELKRAHDLVRRQHETLEGDLRVSAPVSFGQRYLPEILDGFAATHPDVRLSIEMTDRFVDVIEEGFDMALRISGAPAGVSHIWRKIAGVERVMVASADYVSRHGAPDTPDRLSDHAFIGYAYFAGGNMLQLGHRDTGQRVSVPIAPTLDANSGELIAALAADGHGVALLPRFLVSEGLEGGWLLPILEDWRPPDIWLTAFYPPYEKLPAKVAAFTGFVEDSVARYREELSAAGDA